ncbi:MAG: NADH-quinone oxidoreductase subunit NuoF [Chloroflexi bacterium]|nr:NADH-quinone oxidoreductase subunit NuoF [Chloroflexota bacterium]
MAEPILLRKLPTLKDYLAAGGFEGLKKVVTSMKPEEVIQLAKDSGLRGRGGAGFPTGVKWSFLPTDIWPHYVVVNADESEPGTFKDRQIMEENPYQFIEGIALCAYAVQARVAYIYCRGEFWDLTAELDKRIAEAKAAGYLGDKVFGSDWSVEIHTHLGAGAYICGEETALLESMEGKLGQPRLRPPFPAVYGLYGKPTVINNVETLTNVPPIVTRGVEWFRSIGTEKSPGPKVYCLSGNVNKPGNYELPLGTTFRELIYTHGGGIPGDKKIKGILPAGASAPIMPGTDAILDTKMDIESVAAAGSMLGSASIIVVDEDHDMSWVALKTARFFKHESCGKCTPCREGTYWMLNVLERVNKGEAVKADIGLLDNVANNINGKCLCPLGDFATMAVTSSIKFWRADYEAKSKDAKKAAPAAKSAAAKPAPKAKEAVAERG